MLEGALTEVWAQLNHEAAVSSIYRRETWLSHHFLAPCATH